MLFNSIPFLIFFLVVFLFYYLPAMAKYQVLLLVISSLVFYAYGNPWLVLLLLSSAAINILTSYLVFNSKTKQKKGTAVMGVVLNLAIIIFFKYSPLIGKTLFVLNSTVSQFLLTIPLPIGISFFTFEGISLVVDVWKEKYTAEKIVAVSLPVHAGRTLLFISFFPHLIAGPILKAREFFPQIQEKKFYKIDWESAFKLLVTGYFLKMVVADNLKNFTYWIEYPYFQFLSSSTLIAMVFGYSFQIFADFAGYSLIAIGLAKLLGYNFNRNFNFPYISSSFREFWKRWHISLSTFLMEYLYFPLGGSRKGKIRTYVNLMITMILGGLWHGAAWSYAVWGGIHGAALATERFLSGNKKIKPSPVINILKMFVVFSLVTAAWLLFKLPNFDNVQQYFISIAHNRNMPVDTGVIMSILIYSSPVILYHVIYLYRNYSLGSFLIHKAGFVLYAIMLFLIFTNSGSPNSFIYFQF